MNLQVNSRDQYSKIKQLISILGQEYDIKSYQDQSDASKSNSDNDIEPDLDNYILENQDLADEENKLEDANVDQSTNNQSMLKKNYVKEHGSFVIQIIFYRI